MKLSYKYWAAKQFREALDKAIAEALLYIDTEGVASAGYIKQQHIDDAYQKVWERVSLSAGKGTLTGVLGASDIVEDQWKQKVAKYIQTNIAWRKDKVYQYTKQVYRDAIRDAVLQARNEGLGVEATQRKIRKYAKMETSRTSIVRARRIAQTELIASNNYGNYQGMLEAYNRGANIRKQWRVTGGAKAPRHATYSGLDGQTRDIPMPFMVDTYPMQHPGDSSLGAPASETINCRCSIMAVRNDTIEY